MPLPQIWSGLAKSKKDEWAGEDVTRALVVEMIRRAEVETASAERNPTKANICTHHVSRASAFREVARMIQGAIDDVSEEDDEEVSEE